MMAVKRKDEAHQEEVKDIHFPLCGIDVGSAFYKQPNKPLRDIGDTKTSVTGVPSFDGRYARTTPAALNVRSFDVANNRLRGSQRCGLSRYINAQPAGSNLIQDLDLLIYGGTSPTGTMQTSTSGRVVLVTAVSQGKVFVAAAGDTAWTSTVNTTAFNPPLNQQGLVMSAANMGRMWFADGSNWAYYDPRINSVVTWTANGGTLPVDSAGNTPRLIATWRGRTVLSGLLYDPQNWFMSAVSDTQNYDYSPASPSASQAVAGNNSDFGKIGDVVTTIIPYTDDVCIFGGDHTIWQMNGDPMAGGQIDRVSDAIGMCWGAPWCKDPYGTVYFVSNRMGIYSMAPGQGPPKRISQQIENIVQAVNTGTHTIRLIWDDRFQGLHVFITTTGANTVDTHLFWEARVGAWWQDEFASTNFNPLCCCVFDGNDPGDRVALIGSWDGYVRFLDPSATTDDGYAITSYVVIGPILTPNMDELMMKEIQAVLGETSGSVTGKIYVGRTAEMALATDPVETFIWQPGRNMTNFVRRSGHVVYVRIDATNPWAMESFRIKLITTLGKVRQRGF